ncbi:MAG TPA: TonB family protein [Steroidobacter sp.]
MQSTGNDSNLAALQAGLGLPGHVLDVVVLTSDTGLLATLRDASGPEHAVWHASSADAAVDYLVGGRCSILIADLAALRSDAAALLDRLHVQFPELVLMATGRREEEGAVAPMLSDGRLYRFLHKPVSPARAQLFLSAATRRYNELRNIEPVALTTVKTIAANPRFPRIAIAIAVAVVMAAVAAALLWYTRDGRIEPTVTQAQLPAPSREQQIANLLGRAQIAFASGRLAEPRGDSALDYYRAALDLEPNNPDARTGVAKIASVLESRLIEALEARDPARGAAALTVLQRAAPDHPRLDELRTELLALSRTVGQSFSAAPAAPRARDTPPRQESSSAPGSADSSAPAPADIDEAPSASAEPGQSQLAQDDRPGEELETPGESLSSQLAIVARLREQGALIEPAGESAYDRLLALRAEHPQAEELLSEQQRLVFALLERTRQALEAGELEAASVFASRAETLVPGMETTRGLRDQIELARAEREFMRNVVSASSLKRVREVPPEYPREAQRQGLEGWVDVEFTVAPDGTTQDLVVRNSEPPGVFESAALESVERWRFEPVLRDGRPVRQRAMLRVRFVLR